MKQEDLELFISLMAQSLPVEIGAKMPTIYRPWRVGVHYGGENEEKIVRLDPPGMLQGPMLFKCITPHTSQADWFPPITPSLWTYIDLTYAGTLDDPIPAQRSMEYVYGKCYLDPEDDGSVYLCERIGEASGGKITLHYLPHELVGQYFTLVSLSGE